MKKPSLQLLGLGRVPNVVWLTTGSFALAGLFSPNPVLTLGAALLLPWFFVLLWRPGEPPILLLALGIQWLQVTVKVLQADVEGVPVRALNDYGGNIELAIGLGMGALAVMALGMRLALTRYTPENAERAREEALLLSPRRLWGAYLIAVGLGVALLTLSWKVPAITQLAIALANMKWAIYFMLAYVCFLRPDRLWLLLLAFSIEITLGLGAYFSSFKTVFYVTILAFIASGRKLSARQVAVLMSLTALLVVMSLAWTAIKPEYRDYLSGGQQAQIVTRGFVERMQKLQEMVSDLDAEDMKTALRVMAARISYVDFFGRVLVKVPRQIPHEDGALWGGAIRHILMPRLFFPNKPPLRSDSHITNYYTGLKFADDTKGTSVSIGYVAESYIDFGLVGMFAPMLVLGLLWGGMYRYFATKTKSFRVAGYGLAIVVLQGAMLFETTNAKVLGGVVTTFLVAFVVRKLFLNMLVRTLMIRTRPRSELGAPYRRPTATL